MKFFILSSFILILVTSCNPVPPVSNEHQINEKDSVAIVPIDTVVLQDTTILSAKETRKIYVINNSPNLGDALTLWWIHLQKEDNDLLTNNILNDNYSIFIWESNESNGLAKKGKEFLLQYIAGVKNFPDNIILGKYENLLPETDQLSDETILIGFYLKGEDDFEEPLNITSNELDYLIYI